MANILLLNGPNMNLLGQREVKHYGASSLDEILAQSQTIARQSKHVLHHFQSNAEYELIDTIQQASQNQIDFILINPGAFTHTSIALRDALLAVAIPFIEIHSSNIYAREAFRHHSYLADKAIGVITGFGAQSYILALQAANHFLQTAERGEV